MSFVHWILTFIPQHYINFLSISSQSCAVYGTQHGNEAPRLSETLVRPWIERMPIPCSPFLPGVVRCTGHGMETHVLWLPTLLQARRGLCWVPPLDGHSMTSHPEEGSAETLPEPWPRFFTGADQGNLTVTTDLFASLRWVNSPTDTRACLVSLLYAYQKSINKLIGLKLN